MIKTLGYVFLSLFLCGAVVGCFTTLNLSLGMAAFGIYAALT